MVPNTEPTQPESKETPARKAIDKMDEERLTPVDTDGEMEDESVLRVLTMTAAYWGDTYFFKEPCHTSALSGAAWVKELRKGNPTRIFNSFRMTKAVFTTFCDEINGAARVSPWSRVDVEECAAIFLFCVSRKASNRDLRERFQRSGETIHRHFHEMLNIVCGLAKKFIVLPSTPSDILSKNPEYAGQFDNCRLAFDGTHIPASVPARKASVFRDRSGNPSQNVFAACKFDMTFAFVFSGWEGSAADSTVLASARHNGFYTPPGLFDLGDAGYGLTQEVMTPYRGVRYHLKEWAQSNQRPKTPKELYNLRHAQARNVVERAFGVLKRRFPILELAPEYEIGVQAQIVLACCVLHNFIHQCNDPDDDPDNELGDEDLADNAVAEIAEDEPPMRHYIRRSRRAEEQRAKALRDRIASNMWDSYIVQRQQRGLD